MAGGGNIQRSRYHIPRPLPRRRGGDDDGGDGALRAHPLICSLINPLTSFI